MALIYSAVISGSAAYWLRLFMWRENINTLSRCLINIRTPFHCLSIALPLGYH